MHAAVLRYFEAVAEEGSIRRASERLNISASAVNRQILKIEDYFGTPLFERHPDGMRLTEAGKLMLRHSRETLHDFKRLHGEINNLRSVVSGEVAIATLDSLTQHFLPDTLTRFIADHPAVQIRVTAGDPNEILHSVARGTADLGLTFDPVWRGGIHELQNIPCPLHAIMKPDHELAGRGSVTLDECSAYPLIYQDNTGSIRGFLGDSLDTFKRAHKPVLTSNTLALLKRLLLRGVGIAFYTRLGFVEELAEGRLVAVPLESERLTQLRLCLLAPSERSPTVAARVMAEHLGRDLAFLSGDSTPGNSMLGER